MKNSIQDILLVITDGVEWEALVTINGTKKAEWVEPMKTVGPQWYLDHGFPIRLKL